MSMSSDDVKYVCVIVDDFTSKALSFPNVTVVDYGAYRTTQTSDAWYYDYRYSLAPFDYGDVDQVNVVSEVRDYYLVESYFNPVLVGQQTLGPYFDNYNFLYGLYMFEGYTDIYTFESLSAYAPSASTTGHGDWVLESFYQQIDDFSCVEVVAIDVDFTTFEDFSYLFSRPNSTESILEIATNYALQNVYEEGNEYLLAGLSASWGGMTVDANHIAAVEDILDYGSFVVQAVANVNQQSIPWGNIESNVINVGAYNVDQQGHILASDETGYAALDILADGYVERNGWGDGWNFGTSFATPRVFAEIVNFYDQHLTPLILSGVVDPVPLSESDPVPQSEMTSVVDFTLAGLSTPVAIELSGLQEPIVVKVLSDDVTTSFEPTVVPVNLSDSGLIFMSAAPPDTTPPTVTAFSPGDNATAVAVGNNITLTFSEAIQKGSGNIEIRQGSANGTIVESFSPTSTRVTVSGSTLTIDPTNNLANSTQYFVVLPSGSVRDLAGNNFAGTSTYDFTTAAPPDTTPPTVTAFSPEDNATAVAVGNNITLTFSEAIQKGSGNIEIRQGSANGTIVESFSPTSTRVTVSGSTLTIDPSAPISPGVQYFLVITPGAFEDLSGNVYADTLAFSLTGESWFEQEVIAFVPQLAPQVFNSAFSYGDGAQTIESGSESSIFEMGAGSDTLYAGAGNDLIFGYEIYDDSVIPDILMALEVEQSSSVDVLYGGAGNDIYVLDQFVNVPEIIEYSGEGIDTIYGDLGAFVIPQNIENYVNDRSIPDGWVLVFGNELNNTIISSYRNGDGDLWSSSDRYYGGDGSDVLVSWAGDDLLDGGSGVDRMVGGTGDDVYVVDNVRDVVIEIAGEGTDTIETTLTRYSIGKLGAVENLSYSGILDASLGGNALSNVLTGATGNDTLNGYYGADVMVGGAGNDTYVVDDVNDTIVENNGEGVDYVRASVSYELSDYVEHLTLVGRSAIDGTGNDQDNSIRGNTAANILNGGLGHDVLEGGWGNDTLIGGDGNDLLIGGQGRDLLIGGDGSDQFRLNSGLGGLNIDTLYDFTTGLDRIELDNAIFKKFKGTLGQISEDSFIRAGEGVGAADSNDYLIFNTDTCQLFYDPDGNGRGEMVEIAQLTWGSDLAYTDFFII
jgi:Ca2+-binding RTX toxin-like protein